MHKQGRLIQGLIWRKMWYKVTASSEHCFQFIYQDIQMECFAASIINYSINQENMQPTKVLTASSHTYPFGAYIASPHSKVN